MAERCPTCGRAVQVESSAEGTSYYAPAEAERLRAALRMVVRRAEGANARAKWVAEPAKAALDERGR